ncbi:MAG: DUF452 family protein, partial [Muribaculaceae bacterium]|nr:DUF452 family protein [Muribaculaceae bacterium]
ITELSVDLSRIGQSAASRTYMHWDKAIISSRDAIFPPQNQHRHWDGSCETIVIDGPHLPEWSTLINRFLIDKTLVESRFRRSISTYDSEATVQQRIASHLWQLWQKHLHNAINPDAVIEIGPGTGSFTRLYTERLHPQTLLLWDLAPSTAQLPSTVIGCDAEIALMEQPSESADAIVSASTIQWFNSVGNFFRQSLRVLRPGGILAASTFGNQTFRELTQAGSSSLPYTDMESLRTLIPDGFKILEFHDGIITRMFDAPIDVLRHIKATGVNAIRRQADPISIRNLMVNYPKSPDGRAPITYNPIYIVLQKS